MEGVLEGAPPCSVDSRLLFWSFVEGIDKGASLGTVHCSLRGSSLHFVLWSSMHMYRNSGTVFAFAEILVFYWFLPPKIVHFSSHPFGASFLVGMLPLRILLLLSLGTLFSANCCSLLRSHLLRSYPCVLCLAAAAICRCRVLWEGALVVAFMEGPLEPAPSPPVACASSSSLLPTARLLIFGNSLTVLAFWLVFWAAAPPLREDIPGLLIPACLFSSSCDGHVRFLWSHFFSFSFFSWLFCVRVVEYPFFLLPLPFELLKLLSLSIRRNLFPYTLITERWR